MTELKKLWAGQLSLNKAFWIYYIGGYFILFAVLSLIELLYDCCFLIEGPVYPFIITYALIFIYPIFMIYPMWITTASKESGSIFIRYLVRFFTVGLAIYINLIWFMPYHLER